MADSTNQRVSMGFGKVNLKTQGATYAALRLKPQFTKESAITTGKRDPHTAVFDSVSARPEINGRMVRDWVTHPNGTILMIQASWTRGGSPIRDGCVLLRLRQEAAFLNVVAKLPTGLDSLLGESYSVFQGNADILSPEEAAIHKVVIPRGFIDRFFNLDEIDECFEIQEVRPQRSVKPAVSLVSTPQGVVVQEVPSAPSRRMRFRKPTGDPEVQTLNEFLDENKELMFTNPEQVQKNLSARKAASIERIRSAIIKKGTSK